MAQIKKGETIMKLNLKAIALTTVFAILSFCVSAFAETAPVSQIYEPTSIVNVTGKVSDSYDDVVNLLLLDENDNVVHIQEVLPGDDGSYRAKFKFTGDIDKCELMVNQNGKDVTNTVTQSVSYENTMKYDVTATRNATVNAFLEAENYFNVDEQTYKIIIASYDAKGKFIDAKHTETKTVGIDATNDSFSAEMAPGADFAKVFVWNDFETLVPLCTVKTLKKSEINILCIGNSFTNNPTSQLREIAEADGVTLNLTQFLKGGCSLEEHWTAWETDTAIYNWNGGNNYVPERKITEAFSDGQVYDYIIFQQVSNLSGTIDSYSPYVENMVKYLRERQPNAEIVLQETWSYEPGKANDSKGDYEKIHTAYAHWAEELAKLETDNGLPISLDGKPLRVIPSGTAIENARANALFNTTCSNNVSVEGSLNSDGAHLSDAYGCYVTGLTWYGCLTGNKIAENKYENIYPISAEAKTILQNAAQSAIDANGRW